MIDIATGMTLDRGTPPLRFAAGADPRPPGRGWALVVYSWNEDTGVGRFLYERIWNAKERVLVEVEQPAGKYMSGWSHRPDIDRPAVLARYHESLAVTARMQAEGAYGR